MDDWFSEAVKATGPSYVASGKGFQEMGVQAVPFLIRQMEGRPNWIDKSYEKLSQLLPSFIRSRLPEGRTGAYYSKRRLCALGLLGPLGSQQRLDSDAGMPSPTNWVSSFVPKAQKLLHDPDQTTRTFAAQALAHIGPPAAEAVPDLIRLARDPKEHAATAAITALGIIGPPASNAVDVLAAIVASDRQERLFAVVSLGGIGPAAHTAVPMLTGALCDTNPTIRISAARSIAEIGFTPDAALPALRSMRQSTNAWERDVAALALWVREPGDTQLKAELDAVFETERAPWLSSSMGLLGAKAAPFLPQIKTMTSTNPFFRWEALIDARKIEGAAP